MSEFSLPKITVKGKMADVWAKVRTIAANDVKFTGDDAKGTFAGKGVKGRYTVDAQDIYIVITEKPFIVSQDYVKEKILNFFKGL
jgi:hypothetical protein